MYGVYFKENKSDVTIAPKGTVFLKVNSRRASDYLKRYEIDYASFYSLYSNYQLYLIKEEDYPKLEKVKGISKPILKVKNMFLPTWNSKEQSVETKRLIDLFRKANEN